MAFIAGTLGAGGAERQLFYAIRALQEAGARARVLHLEPEGHWEGPLRARGVRLHWVGRSRARSLRLARILRNLRADRPRILHSQHFYTNAYAVAAARLLGLREVGAIRSDPRRDVRVNGPFAGYVNLRAPRLIAVNSLAGMREAVALGVAAERVHYLPNFVDVQEFRPANGRARPLVRILAVGRLMPEKRFDRFLSLLTRVRQRTRMDVRGIVAGAGPQRPQLEEMARRAGLMPAAVEFRGFTADVADLYHEADILVSTSDHEGTPNVVLEAMATGLPVVATTAGGTEEVVRDGESGYLVAADGGDPTAGLADAVTRLAENPALRKRMGAAGRAYACTHHSLVRLPASLLDLYARALGGPP